MLGGLLGLLAACGGNGDGGGEPVPSDAYSRWVAAGVADYSYVLDSQCGERALIGRFRITVRDGAVMEAEGLDGSSQRLVEDLGLDFLPTVDELWDELRQAGADGADEAHGEFDETLGYPTAITIDWERTAIDDEACYQTTEFTRG